MEQHTEERSTKYCIIAMAMYYWGRGTTLGEAKKALRRAGYSRGKVEHILVLGDDKAKIDEYGHVIYAPGSSCHKIT